MARGSTPNEAKFLIGDLRCAIANDTVLRQVHVELERLDRRQQQELQRASH